MGGGPPNTTYSEDASVVSITRMGSVWVTGGAAVIAIGVSFLAPVTQIITMVPKPVMGRVGIVLFGLSATNGIKVLFDNQVNLNDMKNIFVIGIMLILAIGQAVLNIADGLRLTGMSLSSIVGIILNLLLHSNLWIKLKILLNKE
ncbi:solute carrier family 23 protein [Spiroplasma endosymbiont of Eupeodes luniger]|uniref:solute carrier family 23 protein n=1 Tax=Spiroplasma endosymbiont of Eupeodes luniger TaxID=3066300 RepID=UPI0030D59F20